MQQTVELSPGVRRWLLSWARRSIAAALSEAARPDADQVPPEAQKERGCFVSLHGRRGELRGCIGTFDESEPLWEQVRKMAIAAATRDPRFPELTASELEDCEIEISALTPRKPATADEVCVGVHGLRVSRGRRSGVLLPQVPGQYDWDREDFLSQTCIKAGLSGDAWRDSATKIEVFAAEVFSEADCA